MNYNNLRVLGKPFSAFSFKRYLHDRKLPSVLNNYRDTKVTNWIGIESPRKADINRYTVVRTKTWTTRDIDNKSEYDDEYSKIESPYIRED